MTGTMTKIGKGFMAAMLAVFMCVTPPAAAFADEGTNADEVALGTDSSTDNGEAAATGETEAASEAASDSENASKSETASDNESASESKTTSDSENASGDEASKPSGLSKIIKPIFAVVDGSQAANPAGPSAPHNIVAARDGVTTGNQNNETVSVLWENQDGTVLYELNDVNKDAIPAADEYNKLSGKADPTEPDVGDMRHEFTGWFRIDDPDGKVLYIANYQLQSKDAATYALTVKYVLPNGTEAAPSHTETLGQGARYDVPSPQLPGYTPDQEVVRGTMGDQDQTITVTYINHESTSLVDTDMPHSDNVNAPDSADLSEPSQNVSSRANADDVDKATDKDAEKAVDEKAEKPSKDHAEKTAASNVNNATASTADQPASSTKAGKETLPQTGDQTVALGVGVGVVALAALAAAGWAIARRREN